ncbi:MAG: peptidoglycan-binding protein, partial [Rivularia sp. (in: cyanobacteria)]
MQLQERNEQENNHLIDVNNLPTFSIAELTSTRLSKPTLRKGDTGEAVEELQKLLKYWEFYYDVIDGIFSEYVEWAVKAYQHRVYLEEDGIVGSLTWKA